MTFRHAFELQKYGNDKLKIQFKENPSYSSNGVNRCGLSALHALLVYHLGLKEKDDFEINFDPAESCFIINRNPNIIVALDFLLSEHAARTFYLCEKNSYLNQNEDKNRWQKYLVKIIVTCIESKNLKLSEFNNALPCMRAYLNSQHELLKKEQLVTMLNEKAFENYGNDLLKHPFYQTLSILMDGYHKRKSLYTNKGWLEKIGATKPDHERYRAIYRKFIDDLPECYCDKIKKPCGLIEKTLNENKLKQSRIIILEKNDIKNTNFQIPNNSDITNITSQLKL